jgi:5-methylcytosine-specific restriction endonuclease McrA
MMRSERLTALNDDMPRMRRTKRRGPRTAADGPPAIVALLAACPLYPDPIAGACRACGKTLKGRRKQWCGQSCSRSWRTNHMWTYARRAARRRDKYRCTKCGARGLSPAEKKRGDVEGRVHLEVNHLRPLAGAKRAVASCANHLDNLETLCETCHKPITAKQAADRAAARRATKTASLEVAA